MDSLDELAGRLVLGDISFPKAKVRRGDAGGESRRVRREGESRYLTIRLYACSCACLNLFFARWSGRTAREWWRREDGNGRGVGYVRKDSEAAGGQC